MSRVPAAAERKLFLDGVRGWAALVVVLYHTLHGFLSTATTAYDGAAFRFVTDGALAVSVFFVLSGFALSIGFFESGDRSGVLAAALRRYPRLTIPILASSFAAYAVMSAGLMANRGAAVTLGNTEWLGSFYGFAPTLAGWLRFSLCDVYFDFRGGDVYNAALWTMATELYGSMMVFALLRAVGGRAWRGVAYALVALALAGWGGWLIAFLFGMVLADLFTGPMIRRLRGSAAGFVLGAGALLAVVVKSTWFPGLFAGPREMSVVALLVVAAPVLSRPIARVFEGPLSRFLGRMSFPIYLCHLIVICSLSSWCYDALAAMGWSVAAAANLTALVTLAGSFAAAILFEPVERVAVVASRRIATVILEAVAGLWPSEALRREGA